MAVLITGGAGYIGSHAVLECVDRGEDVVVMDDLRTGFAWAVPPGVTLVRGDVADRELVVDTLREYEIDAVMHFAGSVIVPESLEHPLDYFSNNTAATLALLQACVQAGVKRFVFSSTAAVYEAPTSLEPIREDAALAPMSPYGQSKLMSELMVREAGRAHDMTYVILRYFNVAGADPLGRIGLSAPNATHVMKLACEAATGQRNAFHVFGTDYDTPDGTAIRDFIHVADLANVHLTALDFLRAGGRHFTGNAGYSRGYSVREVADMVRHVSGRDFLVVDGPRREGDIPAIVADADRMMHRLDWRPKHAELERIVTDALAWEHTLQSLRGDRVKVEPAPAMVGPVGMVEPVER